MNTVAAYLRIFDDYDDLVIRPEQANAADAIICKQWDLGSPEVRVNPTGRSGADGTDDGPGFTGARTVVFDLQIFGGMVYDPGAGEKVQRTAHNIAERLCAFAHPARRPTLHMRRANVDTGGDDWTMDLRGTPFSIAYGSRAAAMLELQLSFNAPIGYLISPIREFESIPAGVVTVGGITLPAAMPVAFEAGSGTNPVVSFYLNTSAPVSPVIVIYGPVEDPEVNTDHDDERFVFSGLTLLAGEYVVIDMDAGTVRLNGSDDASVYHLVDFTVSTFWRWMPETVSVHYIASSGNMKIQFRERRFTI